MELVGVGIGIIASCQVDLRQYFAACRVNGHLMVETIIPYSCQYFFGELQCDFDLSAQEIMGNFDVHRVSRDSSLGGMTQVGLQRG